MLKALELIGFKSFADKTRFEFPPGITVVVGPNGSGKSNIVDAMKWVLGAQSAKALRGKDMSDVIFKGSSEGGRKMLNAAEATIIFDNAENRLPIEAPEVHVSRRVYRSGESEYLINGQPCRLKDIRDLFRGTGVGTDAYSLIEQGKVERMLQASAKDRRAMFEEAAGISRFKAKKVEAQRRLGRVEQNLLRLSDIVEEVDSRLRSVRSQATKARRYREYSGRLQQLRTQVGLTDWWRLSREAAQFESEQQRLKDESAAAAAELEALEARSLEQEVEITNAVEMTRVSENQLARNREQIVVRESSCDQSRATMQDLEDIAARHRRQLAAMTGRAGDLQARLKETTDGLRDAQEAYDQIRGRVTSHERALAEVTSQLERLRADRETRRAEHADGLKAVSVLGGRISSRESQLESLRTAQERAQQRLTELGTTVRVCSEELAAATNADETFAHEVATKRAALDGARANLVSLRKELAAKQDELNGLQHRQSTVRERALVLKELEESREGLSAGVRDVLVAAGDATDGPLADVKGLVADLLQVSVDIAPLVDVALGDRAQHLVVSGDSLLDEIQSHRYRPAGRVGFMQLEAALDDRHRANLAGRPGVIGRADQLVTCNKHFEPIKQRLLGDTWFVESLSIALALSATAGRGCRFVTSNGELVEPDGAIILGPKLSAMGLVSRRSELRDLQTQVETLRTSIEVAVGEVTSLADSVKSQDVAVTQLDVEHSEANKSLVEAQAQSRSLRERLENLNREQGTLTEEMNAARAEQQSLAAELDTDRAELTKLESVISVAEAAVAAVVNRLGDLEKKREEHALEATTAKVDLAKSEQRLESLQARMTQFEEDRRERTRAIDDSRSQLAESSQKLLDTRREILRTTSELAEMYLRKELIEAEIASRAAERERLQIEKRDLSSTLQSLRRKTQKLEEQLHKIELSVGNLEHERRTLADRIRDDYGIELADVGNEPTEEEQQEREEVEAEIDDLRRKLNNIGAVNMEALNELDDLETRFTSLSGQYNDLVSAKESLERIITKIDADSRRLFEETLEAIRQNFQVLYRKAFGGGRADLVMEQGVDPLEAGVDIIATPPGKPSFDNSLLSGGEKALTAVALLLAIFQYRPSPFCVLDEVDAPFDEANIGRFVDVLRGFLDWTKFIIVTHSKKTMTAATTLYGVTMQESGVSRRVSVRFEDVSDDGHISEEAVQREAKTSSGDANRGVA
ncbi:MAG: chromosome segregation protein SMC [Planctomycetaceae bacterium]|nr:chromosome segregation protein SMC [Planctomycetales bacterium]MCB9940776.1 chromosome segregation protein SMC [Planctomycetaceae bacterium]